MSCKLISMYCDLLCTNVMKNLLSSVCVYIYVRAYYLGMSTVIIKIVSNRYDPFMHSVK